MNEVLADRLAIEDVLVRYATALDAKDWTLLATCFQPGARVRYGEGPPLEGFEVVRAFCEGALARFRATQHLLGNFAIVVEGDAATAACNLQAIHVLADASTIFTVWGRYDDALVRTPGGWRIATRLLEIRASETRALRPAGQSGG